MEVVARFGVGDKFCNEAYRQIVMSKNGNGRQLTGKQKADWQNRIVGYKQIAANELLAHPDNARRHPVRQREALRGSLDTLGIVDAILVNANTGYLIDGHARVEEALSKNEDMLLPVLEVDLNEDEEAQFLISFDWITSLAEWDTETVDRVMQRVKSSDGRAQTMLSEMAQDQGIIPPDFSPVGMGEQPRLDQLEPKIIACPDCGHEFDLRNVES